MFKKGSRYEKCPVFSSASDGSSVFSGIRPRSIGPASGVVEHTISAGERLDLLARHYYNDDRLWWRIVDANPHIIYSGDMLLSGREGEVILIPKGRE